MPITVIASEGLFTEAAEQALFADLTQSFLAHHALTGNKFIEPNVIGEISIIPKGKAYAGGKPAELVIVELKVPSFALGGEEQKQSFVADATGAVLKAGGGRVAKERVYVNMVYTADGLWGIGGKTYSNQGLLDAVGAA